MREKNQSLNAFFPQPARLGDIQFFLGQPEKALAAHAEALRLDPELSWTRAQLVMDYMIMNRLEEAALAAGKADAKQLEGDYFLHGELYLLAFLRNDAAGMAEQVAWSTGKPEAEVRLLQDEASTAAYFGRLVKARELFRRAAASAERAELKDFPAYSILGYWAWEEALCGNQAQARQQINAALRLSRDRYALIDAGLTASPDIS